MLGDVLSSTKPFWSFTAEPSRSELLSLQFHQEFMVSIATFNSSSKKQDALFVNLSPI